MIDTDERLSPHLKLGEFFKSNKAKELGIDLLNPPEHVLKNIREMVAPKVEEAVAIVGSDKVFVSNGWRPLDLNRAIGSKDTSAHILGLAADVYFSGVSLKDAFEKLCLHPTFMLNVDQLIIERGCIHIGMPIPRFNYVPRRELRKESIINGALAYPLLTVWIPTKREV